MARPVKKGLDYFPVDTDILREMKVRKIMRACGAQAIAVLIDLLGNIYGDEGYYMKWDEDSCFLVADDIGASEAAVQEVVNKAVQVDFFNKPLFTEYSILTSKGIQGRYQTAAKQKKDHSIESKFDLLQEVSTLDNGVSSNGNGVIKHDNPQSKVKESKVNKSKKKSKRSGKPNYAPTSEPYKIAKHLLEAIRKNNGDFKPSFSDSDLQRWANDIRLAHERDKREYSKLDRMVDWCQGNSFWQSNILSGAKLREKYDVMAAQANADSKVQRSSHKGTRKEVRPKWMDDAQTQSNTNSKNQLTDAQRKQLAERIAKLATSNEEVEA